MKFFRNDIQQHTSGVHMTSFELMSKPIEELVEMVKVVGQFGHLRAARKFSKAAGACIFVIIPFTDIVEMEPAPNGETVAFFFGSSSELNSPSVEALGYPVHYELLEFDS